MNPHSDYKKVSKVTGEIIAKGIERLEYFTWDGMKFTQKKPLPNPNLVKHQAFITARGKQLQERNFIQGLMPYVKGMMEEDDSQVQHMIEEAYYKIGRVRKSKQLYVGVQTDAMGYTGDVNNEDKVRDFEMFEYTWKVHLECIANALSKIKPKIEV